LPAAIKAPFINTMKKYPLADRTNTIKHPTPAKGAKLSAAPSPVPAPSANGAEPPAPSPAPSGGSADGLSPSIPSSSPTPSGGSANGLSPSIAVMALLDRQAKDATDSANAFYRKVNQEKEAQKLVKKQVEALQTFADAAKAAEGDKILVGQKDLELQAMGDEISKLGGELSKYKHLSKSSKEGFDNARKNNRRLREEREKMLIAAEDMFSNTAALTNENTKLAKLAATRQLNEEKLHKKVQSLERKLKDLSRS
jgi:hypothetical protein